MIISSKDLQKVKVSEFQVEVFECYALKQI